MSSVSVPSGQAVQVALPGVSLKVPLAQGEQGPVPSGPVYPCPQCSNQSPEPLCSHTCFCISVLLFCLWHSRYSLFSSLDHAPSSSSYPALYQSCSSNAHSHAHTTTMQQHETSMHLALEAPMEPCGETIFELGNSTQEFLSRYVFAGQTQQVATCALNPPQASPAV